MSKMETRRYIVSGLVQGVWYRKHTGEAAIEIGVKGWISNTSEGKVELLAKGDLQQHEKLEAALWKGSPMSDVRSVTFEIEDDIPDQGFEIHWGVASG